MNDWEDRIVDSALHELHGSRPPDLSARVVLALQEQARGALPELEPASTQVPDLERGAREPGSMPAPHSTGASLRWAFVAAALVLLGVFVGGLASRVAPPAVERLVQLDVELHEGGLECIEVDAAAPGADVVAGVERRTRHQAPATLAFAARAGNRLRTVEPSRFQVGPFGGIATGPQTELEVRSMSVSWKHGVVAASSLTVAVVAGVITWHTLNKDGTAMAGEVVHLEARAPAVVDPSSAEELAQLRDKVRQLEQQNSDLQLQLLREPARPIEPVAVTEPPPPPEPENAGPVFDDAKYADALAKLDWKLMGEVTNEMAPLLVDLAKAIEEGKELPMDLLAKISELNGKLIAQVPALLKSGLPGSGPNGAYSHPLVSANILAKTLDAAGQGMDQSQRDRIAGLVRMFSVEAQSVADSTQEFDLQKLAAEAESKDRFYQEVSQLLTPEQQAVMFPEGAQRYEGTSLFHSSLFTRQYVDPVSAANPAEFARSVANTYGEQLGLSDQASTQIRGIVERMSGADPALWKEAAGPVEKELRMMRAGRTGAAMQQQVAIMQEILRTVPMSPEQRQKFIAMRRVFVPLPK